MDSLKRCTKCGEEKPGNLEFFYAQAGCQGGLTPRCRDCAKAYAANRWAASDAETKRKSAASAKAWMQANPEWIRNYKTEKRRADPERARAKDARDRASRTEKRREEFRKWYAANRERKLEAARQWRRDNPERVKAGYEKWRTKNPESYAATRRRAHQAFFAKPRNRLDRKIRAGLHKYLSGEGVSRSWQRHVGYSLDVLAAHVERQFLPGMTWQNMGEWHLDHILPLSSFSYDAVTDDEFKAAWALSNLRPVWAAENLQKGSKRLFLV